MDRRIAQYKRMLAAYKEKIEGKMREIDPTLSIGIPKRVSRTDPYWELGVYSDHALENQYQYLDAVRNVVSQILAGDDVHPIVFAFYHSKKEPVYA